MAGSTSNNNPGFTSGGQLFGRDVAQWNIYIGTKVDQNNGYSVNQTLVTPIINGFPLPGSVVGAAVAPLVVDGNAVALDIDSTLQVSGGNLGTAVIPTATVSGNVSGSPAQPYPLTQAQLAALTGAPSLPTGGVIPFAALTAPAGWLNCNGSAVNRTAYAALFAVIGVTYGVGDGSTTFNVPDIRGRVVAGYDNSNATGRLTGSPTGGVSAAVIANAGGEEGHTLTSAEVPATAVLGTVGQQILSNAGNGTQSGSGGGGPDANAAVQGGGGAHNTVQPTLIMNYIIKT